MPAGAQGKTTDMLTRDLFRFVCPAGWYPERADVLGPGVRPDAVFASTANATPTDMRIGAGRLIVESCDLARPVGPGAFHRLAEYLHRSGPTTVGVLASRGPVGPSATDVWRRIAASGVQVYHVDDAILHAMLRAHLARLEGDTSRDPWAVMRFAQPVPP